MSPARLRGYDKTMGKLIPLVKPIRTLEEYLRVNGVVNELLNELNLIGIRLKIGLLTKEEHGVKSERIKEKIAFFERRMRTYRDK